MQTFLKFGWAIFFVMFSLTINIVFADKAFAACASNICVNDANKCVNGEDTSPGVSCPTNTEPFCCKAAPSGSCTKGSCQPGATCPSGMSSPAACSGSAGGCPTGQIYCESTSTNTGGSGTSIASISFINPLKYSTVQEVLMALLHALQGVIVVLSLVFIVLGAVFYITSAGNSARVSMAKLAITASLIGLSIGILAPTFLKEIASVLGWGGNIPPEVVAAPTAANILLAVLNFLLSIVGVLAIIMLVVGAIMFFGSAGSPDRITTGKKIITFSIIGIVVALASLVIVRQIAEFFASP